jgi:hypothetical protein
MYIVISEFLSVSPDGNVRTDRRVLKANTLYSAQKYKEKNRNKIVKILTLREYAEQLESVKAYLDDEVYLL